MSATISSSAAFASPASWGFFPFIVTVPAEVANKGVYAAIFGLLGPEASPPQVYLNPGNNGTAYSLSGSMAFQEGLNNQFFLITSSTGFNPKGGAVQLTQTAQGSQQIEQQLTLHYSSFNNGKFSDVQFIHGKGGEPVPPNANLAYFFDPSRTTVKAIAPSWIPCSTLSPGAVAPLVEVVAPGGSHTSEVTVMVPVPPSGGAGGANDISSGELVLFVGPHSGLIVNSSKQISVPTLASNPYDTFALFEWGLSGDLKINSGGSIDYDVSAIDQVGFPFKVNASIYNPSGAPANPPQPFNNGVGFLQTRQQVFSGFSAFLNGLPASANSASYLPLAPENSLFAKRITAPQDWLEAVVQSGPTMLTEPAGISGMQPIQVFPAGSGTTLGFSYSVNTAPATVVINPAGSGYTTAPTLTLTASPLGASETATATASLSLSGGAIQSVTITNAGSGYTATPLVSISAEAGSSPASIYVQLAPKNFYYAVTAVRLLANVSNGGSGYTSAPTVQFSAPASGQAATGTAIVANGVVTGIYITSPGSGYTTAPTILFTGGGGTGAAATASFVESMMSQPLMASLSVNFFGLVNWYPYPSAAAYNVYRNTGADFSSGSELLNASPLWFTPFTGTTSSSISSGATSVTVTAAALAGTPSAEGTLVIGSGSAQSFFQYSAVTNTGTSYTFTGNLYSTQSNIAAGAEVQLLLNFADYGNSTTSQNPPLNNYDYEPLNQYFTQAILDFFDYYKTNEFILDIAGIPSGRWSGNTCSITVGGTAYTILQLTCSAGIYGNNCNGQTVNIYQPFFNQNINPSAVTGVTLQNAPAWLNNPTESGSSMVFGADGVFDLPDNVAPNNGSGCSTASSAIVKDLMNPINIALNRGLTPRKLANGSWTNVLPPDYWTPQGITPVTFSVVNSEGTLAAGTYYYAVTGVNISNTSSSYNAYATGESIPSNIMTVTIATANSQVILTIPNTGAITYTSFNIYRGSSPETMTLIKTVTPNSDAPTPVTDNGLPNGTVSPPVTMYSTSQTVNLYAAYIHQLSVSINGFAYATPYDDQGGFSTNVQLYYNGATPNPPQSLDITLLPWE